MCEALNQRPIFKGVIVNSSTLLTIFLTLVGLRHSLASNSALNSAIQASEPYCIYLEQSQELRCNCQNFAFNRSQPRVFPSNDFFVPTSSNGASKVQQVAAMKLTGCEKLHLTLDLRPLPHPFYR